MSVLSYCFSLVVHALVVHSLINLSSVPEGTQLDGGVPNTPCAPFLCMLMWEMGLVSSCVFSTHTQSYVHNVCLKMADC